MRLRESVTLLQAAARNAQRVTVNRRFTATDAQVTLKDFYPSINLS